MTSIASDLIERSRKLLEGITPGPWADSDRTNQHEIYAAAYPGRPIAHADSYWHGDGPRKDERAANARLIAAAPTIIAEQAEALSQLTREVDELRALISEESIERLATDIAIACVDCRDEIRDARHRAMVRLGERLRKPLSRDLEALSRSSGGAK